MGDATESGEPGSRGRDVLVLLAVLTGGVLLSILRAPIIGVSTLAAVLMFLGWVVFIVGCTFVVVWLRGRRETSRHSTSVVDGRN